MTNHTPTPYAPMYEVDDENQNSVFITAMWKGERIGIAEIYNPEDAPFIINACNAHDDLVAALEGVIRVADRKTVEFDAAHAALAKAKVQS